MDALSTNIVKSIHTVAVLGLGTMGHGIAQVFATAGCRVLGYDEDAGARASLHERVRQNLEDFVIAGLARKRDVPAILKRIVICDREEDAVRDRRDSDATMPTGDSTLNTKI